MFTRVWKHVVQKGDAVIDATCGNGYDTLAMVKMVADESARGCVYAMDIQNDALENTSSLLEESLNPNEVLLSHSSIYIFYFLFFYLRVFQCAQHSCMQLILGVYSINSKVNNITLPEGDTKCNKALMGHYTSFSSCRNADLLVDNAFTILSNMLWFTGLQDGKCDVLKTYQKVNCIGNL